MNNNLNAINYNTLKPKSDALPSEQTAYNPTTELVNNYLSNDTTMYDNVGKFFDPYLFNKKFDKYVEQQSKKKITGPGSKTTRFEYYSKY